MKNKKLKLVKDVLKVLTPAEMAGVVAGTAPSSPQAGCGLPGTVAGCESK
jgi:hypothetical protein